MQVTEWRRNRMRALVEEPNGVTLPALSFRKILTFRDQPLIRCRRRAKEHHGAEHPNDALRGRAYRQVRADVRRT
jgi:hypothetical protein